MATHAMTSYESAGNSAIASATVKVTASAAGVSFWASGDRRIGIDSLHGGSTADQKPCEVTASRADVQGPVEASRQLPQDPAVVWAL